MPEVDDILFPSGSYLVTKILSSTKSPRLDSGSITSEIENAVSEQNFALVVFLFPGENPERKFYSFVPEIFKTAGKEFFPLDAKKYNSKDFAYLKKVSQFLRNKSEFGSILFLLPHSERPSLQHLIPIFFLRPLHDRPEKIIEYTLGQKGLTREDRYTCEYLKFLNSRYTIPARFRTRSGENGSLQDSLPKLNHKYSIRFKLLGITTFILTASISGMIWLASLLFKENSSVLIQDYNLNLARLIGDVIESDLENLIYRTELFSTKLPSAKNFKVKGGVYIPDPPTNDVNEFFVQNPSVVAFLSFRKNAEDWTGELYYFNQAYIQDFPDLSGRIDPVFQANGVVYQKSRLNVRFVQNIQSDTGYPLIALSLPAPGNLVSKKTFVAIVSPSYFLKSFQSSRQGDFFELYLTDLAGQPILSTKPQVDIAKMPIVQKMLVSGIDNGSSRFEFQNSSYLGSFRILNRFGLGIISSVPEDKAFEAVYRIQKQNILLLIMILSVTFPIIYLFAKTLSIPIINLVQATRRIELGDYEVEITPSTNDEIGILTRSFSSMARGLHERQLIKEEFGKFVNPEIAERALKGKLSLGGERKHCTVFFSDIRNFTSLSESREPEEVVEILNEYFTEMVDCIQITGGVVDKFIGDAVMAHWGAITPRKEDARKAVDSALLMRLALIDLNQKLKEKGKPPIRIGCGINTGPVIAGQIGSQKRLEFTVIGDAVNLASRIEYLNKDFGSDILISESTYLALGENYHCLPMEPIFVRGKEKPQRTYIVLGKENDPQRPKSLQELQELIGMNPEAKGEK